jgi:hypothetical protein
MKGLAIALLILAGFYAYEKISGQTTEGNNIDCSWTCEKSPWSYCVNGVSERNIGDCSKMETCLCVADNAACYGSNALPPVKKACN